MLYIAKECITHGQVRYSNIQLQLTLSENLRNKTTRCYGQSINKFTKLSCGSPLHKLNHTGKCLSYFHPSYGSDNCKITAESQTIFSYSYYLSVSSCKPKAVKSDNVLAVYIRILMLHFKFVLLTCRSDFSLNKERVHVQCIGRWLQAFLLKILTEWHMDSCHMKTLSPW